MRTLYIIAIIVALVAGVLLTVYWRGNARYHFYESVNVGVPFTSTQKPDGFVNYKTYRILYFWGISPFATRKALPEEVSTLSDLPFVYDAIQIVLDVEGRVVAKAWCGETTTIQTIKGSFKGSSLHQLTKTNFLQ